MTTEYSEFKRSERERAYRDDRYDDLVRLVGSLQKDLADASATVALVVEAAGGSVFVPDNLTVGPDLTVSVDVLGDGRTFSTRTIR